MTLRTVAERWLEAQLADGVRDADRDLGRFKNHVDPLIGSKRIGDIEAQPFSFRSSLNRLLLMLSPDGLEAACHAPNGSKFLGQVRS